MTVQTETAGEIVKAALRKGRILEEGAEPSGSEMSDALTAFNGLIDSLGNSRRLIMAETRESFTWPASTASRSIGSGGDFDTVWPIKILSAYVTDSANVSSPIRIVEFGDYDRVTLKQDEGSQYPSVLYHHRKYPLADLYLIYMPSSAVTLNLTSHKPLTQVANKNTAMAYPPGYYNMFVFNLARNIVGEYGKVLSNDDIRLAEKYLREVKRSNKSTPTLQLDGYTQDAPNIFGGF